VVAPGGGVAGARPLRGHGDPERHPRLVLRRRPLRRPVARRRARCRDARRRGRPRRRRRGSRPGPARSGSDAATERDRVLPVVRELVAAGVRVSVDTTRSAVAEACVEAGCGDGQRRLRRPGRPADGRGRRRVADALVIMHWRGHSAGMQQLAGYEDVIGEVRSELRRPGRPRRDGRGRPPAASCSTPVSGSPRTPRTTGRCCAGSTCSSTWGSRCWSGPRASGSSASSWPRPRASRAPPPGRDIATRRGQRARRQRGRLGRAGARRRVHDGRHRGRRRLPARRLAPPHTPREDRAVSDRIELRGLRVPREPRRVRPRASRRPGVRRRPGGARPTSRPPPPRTTWPTRCTTASSPSWPRASSAGPARDLIEAVAGEIAQAVLDSDARVRRRRGDAAQAVGADPADLRRRRGRPDPEPGVTRAILSLGSNLGDRGRAPAHGRRGPGGGRRGGCRRCSRRRRGA
jgi:hypothetical protein